MLIDIKSREVTIIIVTLAMLLLIAFYAVNEEFDNIEKLTIQQNELLRKEILILNTEENILKIIIETTLDTNIVIMRRPKNE